MSRSFDQLREHGQPRLPTVGLIGADHRLSDTRPTRQISLRQPRPTPSIAEHRAWTLRHAACLSRIVYGLGRLAERREAPSAVSGAAAGGTLVVVLCHSIGAPLGARAFVLVRRRVRPGRTKGEPTRRAVLAPAVHRLRSALVVPLRTRGELVRWCCRRLWIWRQLTVRCKHSIPGHPQKGDGPWRIRKAWLNGTSGHSTDAKPPRTHGEQTPNSSRRVHPCAAVTRSSCSSGCSGTRFRTGILR